MQEELRELCASLAIEAEDSDVIFTDLDQDEDGKISYEEFSRGFTEFLNPEFDVQASRRFSVWLVEEGVVSFCRLSSEMVGFPSTFDTCC